MSNIKTVRFQHLSRPHDWVGTTIRTDDEPINVIVDGKAVLQINPDGSTEYLDSTESLATESPVSGIREEYGDNTVRAEKE